MTIKKEITKFDKLYEPWELSILHKAIKKAKLNSLVEEITFRKGFNAGTSYIWDMFVKNNRGVVMMKMAISKKYKISEQDIPILDGPVDPYKTYGKTKSGRKAAKKPVRGSAGKVKRGK